MNDEFQECLTCASKSGTPVLCNSCLHNRTLIVNLKKALAKQLEFEEFRAKMLTEATGKKVVTLGDVVKVLEDTRKMKLYKHQGAGHFIGSVVLVVANSTSEAVDMIRKELDEYGLSKETVDIVEEINILPDTVVHVDDGDY